MYGVAEPRPSESFTPHYITPALQPPWISGFSALNTAVRAVKPKIEQKEKVVIFIHC